MGKTRTAANAQTVISVRMWAEDDSHNFRVEAEEVARLIEEGFSSGFDRTDNERPDGSTYASGYSFDKTEAQ